MNKISIIVITLLIILPMSGVHAGYYDDNLNSNRIKDTDSKTVIDGEEFSLTSSLKTSKGYVESVVVAVCPNEVEEVLVTDVFNNERNLCELSKKVYKFGEKGSDTVFLKPSNNSFNFVINLKDQYSNSSAEVELAFMRATKRKYVHAHVFNLKIETNSPDLESTNTIGDTFPGSIICTAQYTPVCGIKDGKESSFGNQCVLSNSGADFLHSGKCKSASSPDICPAVYSPVCGTIYGIEETYVNECILSSEDASYLHVGECSIDLPPVNTAVYNTVNPIYENQAIETNLNERVRLMEILIGLLMQLLELKK